MARDHQSELADTVFPPLITSRRAAEKRLAAFAVLVGHALVQLNSEAGLIRYGDITILDERGALPFNQVVKEWHRSRVPFQRQKIRDGGAKMHRRHRPNGA